MTVIHYAAHHNMQHSSHCGRLCSLSPQSWPTFAKYVSFHFTFIQVGTVSVQPQIFNSIVSSGSSSLHVHQAFSNNVANPPLCCALACVFKWIHPHTRCENFIPSSSCVSPEVQVFISNAPYIRIRRSGASNGNILNFFVRVFIDILFLQ